MTVIKPTVGRIVWYWPPKVKPSQPLAAMVAYVHEEDDRFINIGGLTRDAVPFSALKVRLIQEGEEAPAEGNYAQWMPYQVGQAKKHHEEPK